MKNALTRSSKIRGLGAVFAVGAALVLTSDAKATTTTTIVRSGAQTSHTGGATNFALIYGAVNLTGRPACATHAEQMLATVDFSTTSGREILKIAQAAQLSGRPVSVSLGTTCLALPGGNVPVVLRLDML